MNSNQIRRELTSDAYSKRYFKGVLARDQLPNKIKKPAAYIINTENSDKKGEHWLALFYDRNCRCDFFDSFGLHPAFYNLEKYLYKTSSTWQYNKNQLQSLESSYCGNYCIYFILLRSRGF